MSENAAPADAAPFAHARTALARLVGWLVSLFGLPGEIAVGPPLSGKRLRTFRLWVRLAESMARALVFALAAAAGASNAPPKRWRPSFACGHGRGGFANEDSSAWSVRVRFLAAPRGPRTAARTGTRKAPSGGPERGVCPLASAERLEALIRVAADPDRYARRRAARADALTQPDGASAVAIVSRPGLLDDLFGSFRSGDRAAPAPRHQDTG